MADEKAREPEIRPNEQDKRQGDGCWSQRWLSRTGPATRARELQRSKPNESAGQGGGIQGTGQRQSNPGGFTGGEECSAMRVVLIKARRRQRSPDKDRTVNL